MAPNKETFKKDYEGKLIKLYRTGTDTATDVEKYLALGAVIRDYIADDWYKTDKDNKTNKSKQVFYFSMEFLIGRLMDSALINLGIRDVVEQGLSELGINLKLLEEVEPDAGLGNGGLGRLAACFMDSMASLGVAGMGVGIRYRYGLFKQEIINGYQIETPDNWLRIQNVWEERREKDAVIVRFGGNCEVGLNEQGKIKVNHTGYEPILAIPYDIPVPGYMNGKVNTLRLWSAETEGAGFDFKSFSKGDYEKAMEGQLSVQQITSVLYPDDSTERGRRLRLKQEYFFTSAGIQSIIRAVKKQGIDIRNLADHVAIHINDTHPAMAVPELMRILIDEEGLEWDEAWEITKKTLAYTNHTILAEALEKWNRDMLKTMLPRIFMLIEEINRRQIIAIAAKYGEDEQKISRMEIISGNQIRMANLAITGSHSVNGVAALHTEILKTQELKDFHEFYPGKFNNKTNGITHRRWLIEANPKLTSLINETIGEEWKKNPLMLSQLKPYTNDSAFLDKFAAVKRENKERLGRFIKENYNISVDPDSIFDVQSKRLHMYKRQLLNIIHVMDLYRRLKEDPNLDIAPHTYIFAAKAFPGYQLAKNTIKLINTVADKVNRDEQVRDKLKIVFMPNYGVSLAEILIPAGDVSEQISTASKEASGTGNMKFMMNGAVTCATMDGANVEIHHEVGDDNIVIFGLSSDEVINYQNNGGYSAADTIANDPRLKNIILNIESGMNLCPGEFGLVLNHLIDNNDPYFTLKDFASYADAQAKVDALYKDRQTWARMAAMNTACSGVFSSDNTIRRYAEEIWKVDTTC